MAQAMSAIPRRSTPANLRPMPAVATAPVPAIANRRDGLRIFPIRFDYMAPTLRHGDLVLVRPCDRFLYQSMYIVGLTDPMVYRVASTCNIKKPEYILSQDASPPHAAQTVPREWLNQNVVGLVVATVSVLNRRLMPSELQF